MSRGARAVCEQSVHTCLDKGMGCFSNIPPQTLCSAQPQSLDWQTYGRW